MSLMDELVSELKLSQQAAESDEAQAQKDYEEVLADSQKSRQSKSKQVVALQEQKSGLEEKSHEEHGDKVTASEEHQSLIDKGEALHDTCDFLLNNYDLRKKARADEVEAMQQGLSILSGADFALTQTRLRR